VTLTLSEHELKVCNLHLNQEGSLLDHQAQNRNKRTKSRNPVSEEVPAPTVPNPTVKISHERSQSALSELPQGFAPGQAWVYPPNTLGWREKGAPRHDFRALCNASRAKYPKDALIKTAYWI